MIRVAAAGVEALDAAWSVIRGCREALAAQGIQQWDSRYPSRSFLHEAIAGGSLFALFENERIQGIAVLDELQPPEWEAATWKARDGFLVLHAFAISPSVQDRGLGRQLLSFCETLARERNYTSIRLDAFSENATALRFHERNGYSFRGHVQFESKPAGHQCYRCYEKSLA